MKVKFLQITLIALLFISCKEEKENEPSIDNNKFYIKYDNNEFEIKGGLLYLYDKINNYYHYTTICGNSGFTAIGWGINDTYSDGDYIKLHFKGDSISNLRGQYFIIPDSNCYIVFGYNRKLNTCLIKDYIVDGSINAISNNGYFPPKISFQGKTKLGKTVLFNSLISSPEVSYKLTRHIMGDFLFQDRNYKLSDISVYRDSLKYDVILNDIDLIDSLKTQIRFWMFKTDNFFEGNYYGLNAIGSNSFHGMMDIRTMRNTQLYYRYFNQGDIKITKTEYGKYKIDFKLLTSESDSIKGQWESNIDLKN
jgi:hypothetical protein